MRLPRLRRRWFGETRRGIRALERLAAAVETQNTLLTRMADVVAPLPGDPADPADTDLPYLTDADRAIMLDYQERVERQTGQSPSADELWNHLAEVKTVQASRS